MDAVTGFRGAGLGLISKGLAIAVLVIGLLGLTLLPAAALEPNSPDGGLVCVTGADGGTICTGSDGGAGGTTSGGTGDTADGGTGWTGTDTSWTDDAFSCAYACPSLSDGGGPCARVCPEDDGGYSWNWP